MVAVRLRADNRTRLTTPCVPSSPEPAPAPALLAVDDRGASGYHWAAPMPGEPAVRLQEDNSVSMDRLWAPWRMEYIEEVDQPHGCFLCRAAQTDDDRAALVLWRSDECLAVMNRWPYNNGHLLIAPLRHTGELEELTENELAEQMTMLKRCRANLAAVMSPDGFNVGLNLGRSAGAGVEDHLHWHIVPRWNGDTNFMPVAAAAKVIPQSLETLWELLREAAATQ